MALSFSGSLLIASGFVLSRYCRRFTLQIKHRWSALSAGVAVSYVFISLLPELEEHRTAVAGSAIGTLLDVEKRIYLWALAGFVAFSGLSRLRSARVGESPWKALLYPGEMAGCGLYGLLIGYLLVRREDTSVLSLGLFVFAIGLHLFMVDGELGEQFEQRYKWGSSALLASCVLLGWVLGIINAFPDSFTSRLFAFLGGGILITSVHAEVRAEEGTRFWWFVGGAATYATLLMLV